MASRISGGGGTLKDLKPIKGAKVSGDLRRIATSKSTPKVRARPPQGRKKPKSLVVKAKPRPARTISEQASRNRLAAQVEAKRRTLAPRSAETGDILKGTVVVKRKRGADGLKRELEGRGQAVKLSGKLAKEVTKNPQFKVVKKVAGIIPGLGGLEERFAKDIINLPAQAIPSLYVPIAGAVEAARGRPERLRQLGKDIKRSDPLYAAGEAVVKGVTGDTKGAKKAAGRAVKLAKEHPGFTAVEVAGAKGTVGRGVTRAQRVAGKRPTTRPPATVPGTDIEQPRAYSKDAFTRAGQKMTERNRTQRAARARAEANALEKRDPGRHADRIDELRSQADRVDPTRLSEREIRKRASERVAVNELVRRENRVKVGQEVREAISPRASVRQAPGVLAEAAAEVARPVGRESKALAKLQLAEPVAPTQPPERGRRQKATAATTLAVQNITDATPGDMARYKGEIAAQYEGLSAAGRKVNRRLQGEIQKAIDARPDPAALRSAAEAYKAIIEPRQRALVERGLLPAASADKAKLVPYAVRKMGAKVTDEGPVDARTGKPLRSKGIRAHMKAHGVPEPAYVTQSPSPGNAFFVPSDKSPSIPGSTRTGSATVKGTFDAGPDVLVEGAARAQGLIDAAEGFTRSVGEFAHKPSMGKLKTKRDADAKARELSAQTGVEYRPVRLQPFAGRQEQLQKLLDSAGGEGLDQQLGHLQPVREALEGAFKGEDGPGPWALIPRAAADELAAHMAKMGTGPVAKSGQLIGQAFRRTVLSTSPSWMAGNLIEANLRTALAGAGPSSYRLGKRVLREVDALSPRLGQELRARAVGGGHFRSADTLHVRRGAEQFQGTSLEPLARGLSKFWQTPGPKHAALVWNRWTDLVFRQLNGRMESGYQTAMLGRALRESPLMDNDLPRLSQRAVEQAARGLTNTNEQAALARSVERMYGKYAGFNAGTRWAITMYTPFIPWTLNAIKFVFDVLPRDHPTVTGLIAASEQWTDEWRKERGLDLFIEEAVPGFLQGSIPLGEGRHQRAPHRYTPFGAFGDPLDTAAKAVLPQYSGILAAFKGEDWKGAQLLNPVNPPSPPKPKARARTSRNSVDAALDAALSGGSSVDRALDEALGGLP